MMGTSASEMRDTRRMPPKMMGAVMMMSTAPSAWRYTCQSCSQAPLPLAQPAADFTASMIVLD